MLFVFTLKNFIHIFCDTEIFRIFASENKKYIQK